MKVAVLFSGGKDSTFAVNFALEKGWDIDYLLSIKPTRTDCFLFHFATVEHTPILAEAMRLKHYLLSCDVADPMKEADIVKDFVKQHPVDAVILGGTGLQQTQIRSIQNALRPSKIEVFASHAGQDHDLVMKEMLSKGFRFVITQIASDGLNSEWLGKELTQENMKELFARSLKYGFHCGGEGGYYDTFCIDAPIFNKKFSLIDFTKVMESDNSGYLIVKKIEVVPKIIQVKNNQVGSNG